MSRTGIEPVLMEPESIVLSIRLPGQIKIHIEYFAIPNIEY